jgi:hypothetical protein
MSTEEIREELGELLHQNITDSLPVDPTKRELGAQVDIAIDILVAAGYRKPQQVTTVRELHTLPDSSVVRSEYGSIFEKDGGWWAETGTRDKSLAVDIALPATVLHVGGAE